MNRWTGAAIVTVLAACGTARADEKGANAVIDKAVKALGGGETLSKVRAFSTKGKGTVSVGGNDISYTGETTIQGVERCRSEFESESGGNTFKGLTVVNGDKAWRKFGGNSMELAGDALANEKRMVYLQSVPVLVLPLKGKGFKVDSAPDDKVGDRPAAAIKATGPDGKDFTLSFDKESGLPVRLSARVADWQGQEYDQVTTFESYKEFDGIKKATKTVIKRDGEPFIESEVTEFKVIKDPMPDTFAEPK